MNGNKIQPALENPGPGTQNYPDPLSWRLYTYTLTRDRYHIAGPHVTERPQPPSDL